MSRRPVRRGACACTEHAEEVLAASAPLLPYELDMAPVTLHELSGALGVEWLHDPDEPGHHWQLWAGDEVQVVADQHDDGLPAHLLAHPGVESVLHSDREVLQVAAPTLCRDGVLAALLRAVTAANGHAVARAAGAAEPFDLPALLPERADAAAPTTEDDDRLARLVTGDAVLSGRPAQLWVLLEGLLVLPAGTLPHGPLEESDNPRLHKADVDVAGAQRLVGEHGGRWLAYADVQRAELQAPSLLRRGRRLTVETTTGDVLRLQWSGPRAHAAVLWGYCLARLGRERFRGAI